MSEGCIMEAIWKQTLFRTILKRSQGHQENGQRASYAPWFKEALHEALDCDGSTYQQVSDLTGVPIKTLENFKEFSEKLKSEKSKINAETINQMK